MDRKFDVSGISLSLGGEMLPENPNFGDLWFERRYSSTLNTFAFCLHSDLMIVTRPVANRTGKIL